MRKFRINAVGTTTKNQHICMGIILLLYILHFQFYLWHKVSKQTNWIYLKLFLYAKHYIESHDLNLKEKQIKSELDFLSGLFFLNWVQFHFSAKENKPLGYKSIKLFTKSNSVCYICIYLKKKEIEFNVPYRGTFGQFCMRKYKI